MPRYKHQNLLITPSGAAGASPAPPPGVTGGAVPSAAMSGAMRRFKIKDLLVFPSGLGAYLGGFKPDCLPVTDRKCTVYPPEDASQWPCKTDTPTQVKCAANSDTTLGCALGDDTYLPCVAADGTIGHCYNPQKTKFRCVYKKGDDTKGVCRGGSATDKPGWTDDPWRPCKDSKPCVDGSSASVELCYVGREPVTAVPCQKTSDTKKMCAQQPKGDHNRTDDECKDEFTDCDYGHQNKTYCEDDKKTCRKDTKQCKDEASQEFEAGLLGCLPFTTLAAADDDPGALHALAILRRELQRALSAVNERVYDIERALTPQTPGDAEVLEQVLTQALEDTRELKQQLESGSSSSESSREAPKGDRPKKPRRK